MIDWGIKFDGDSFLRSSESLGIMVSQDASIISYSTC